MSSSVTLRLAFALALLAGTRLAAQSALSIAAAANFIPVLGPLDAAFEATAPGTTVTPSAGASGSLYAQIANGAPFDVFLSADLEFPRKLAQSGFAVGTSLTPFATGRLVLWTTLPGRDPVTIVGLLSNPRVHRVAIANPQTAPYGKAAKQALERLGLYAALAPRLVTGENISQTAQFVDTGNAQAGFVALSLVLSPGMKDRGRWVEVPAGLYAPLVHAAILTNRGAANPEARRYLLFLGSPAARAILARFGYGTP